MSMKMPKVLKKKRELKDRIVKIEILKHRLLLKIPHSYSTFLMFKYLNLFLVIRCKT